MGRINILNKQGLLTDEDRKEPLVHSCHYLTFQSCLDLSEPVRISYGIPGSKVPIQMYTRDIADFFCWWDYFIKKDLNGFSGMSHVKFELVDFEIQM